MRWALGVIFGTILVYAWGFYFFGFSGFPNKGLTPLEEPAAVGEALVENFPENGVYLVPGYNVEEEAIQKLHKSGPLAFVFMTSINGEEVMDFGLLYRGFCHTMLTCIFLAILLGVVNVGIESMAGRLRFFLLVGLLIALYGQIGSAVWWRFPYEWQLIVAAHDWVAIFLGGVGISLLAPFAEDSY